MRVVKTVSMTHPTSFDLVHLNVVANRDVFQIRGNGGNVVVDQITSKVITIDEFKDRIVEEFGDLKHFDTYVDEEGREVIRGIVVDNHIRKAFIQRFDELTETILEDVIKVLQLTKPWTDGL